MTITTLRDMTKCSNYNEYFMELLNNPFTKGNDKVPKSMYMLIIRCMATSTKMMDDYGLDYYGYVADGVIRGSVEVFTPKGLTPVITLYVAEKWRHKGTAEALLRHVSSRYQALVLEVEKTNYPMLRLMDKLAIPRMSFIDETKTHCRFTIGKEIWL